MKWPPTRGWKGHFESPGNDCFNPLWESLFTNQRNIFFRWSWGSIVAAVEKGRAIYSGIQKFVGEPRAFYFNYKVGPSQLLMGL